MMPKRYVEKLDASEGDLPGLYGIEHARKPGSWRFVCSYADAKRYKQVIFDRLRKAGQPEAAKTWEWHHVVEGQHFADIDFAGEFSRAYLDELPCVLIAKEEHLRTTASCIRKQRASSIATLRYPRISNDAPRPYAPRHASGRIMARCALGFCG